MEFANKLLERTGKGYLSYSALKFASDNSKQQDMKLFELYMKGLLQKDSPALTFGSAYDCLLLTPEKFGEQFFVVDDSAIVEELSSKYKSPKSSGAYKEWYKSEMEIVEKNNLIILSEDEHTQIVDMINRLDASEVLTADGELLPVRDFLRGDVQKEIADWIGDIPVRGFLDVSGNGFVSDSKTTRSIHGFKYDVFSFCYDIQAYIYTQVMGTNDFYWVVQDKSKPYLCGVYKASEQTLASGEKKFWSAVQNIQRWLDNPSKDTETFAMFGSI